VNTRRMTPASTGIVEVEGAQLRYVAEGDGPTCLVVGSSVFYPRMFSPGLRGQLRLVFVDLRHFAASDPFLDLGLISVQTYADDIERVRQALRLGNAVVIGHSIHGTIALDYAKRFPANVRGVVAIGAYPYRRDSQPDAADLLWETDASPDRKEALARQLAKLTPDVRSALSPEDLTVREIVADAARNWYDPTYDPTWLWDGVVPNVPILDRVFDELYDTFDLEQGPARITTPVLIAHGRYDYNAAYTLWGAHKHKLSRHTYALFARSGHYPPLEESEQFDQTLLTWVRGLA
jgi:proline iminopeptidase